MRVGGLFACSLGLLLSCSRAAPEAKNATPARAFLSAPASQAKSGAGPRLFPPTHGPGTQEAGVDHDGSRRLLAFGLRVVEHPDGSLDVGDELLPAARSARFLELPGRLGGGFVFWIVSSNGTLLYRSASWTAKLEPFAQLDFEVERLVPGFDRLLVLPRHDADYRALDLDNGQPVPPVGLPRAPAYGAMAFVDGWFAAVQVPLRGVLLSFDAGSSWHPLSLPVTSFEPAGDALALATSNGDYLLSARGALSRVADRDEAKVSEAAQAELQRALSVRSTASGADRGSESLLEAAILTGFPDGRGSALVATSGTLSRVLLDSGKLLERREHAYVGAAECLGVRFGAGVGFVCGQARELTRIYRVTEPFGLSLVRELPGARVVSDSGSGALVIHGGCSERGSAFEHCILPPVGAPHEVRSTTERDRVVALADGRVAVITPPDARGPGALTLWTGEQARAIPLALTHRDPKYKPLLEQGVWLDGVVETKPGTLSGWVVGAGPFAGFELQLDGKLTLRRIQDGAGHALFAGKRALVLGENGLASETTDGGVEWQGVELPPEIDLKRAHGQGMRQGCSPLGCGFAGFTRVGYFDGRAARSLAAPATPARVAFPGPGGSRWLLQCAATGEVSAPALPFRPPTPLSGRRLHRSAGADEPELQPLSPLLDQPPPPLPDNFEGVDAGTEPYGVQMRLYAYGPRGADWTKSGSFSIAFADRFATKPGVRVTANARSPWPDALGAADALGAEPSTNTAGLVVALDPSGTAGALLLSSRGTLDLFVFEAGRVPQHLPNVGRLGLGGRLAGVVKTKTGVLFGSYDESSRAFRVYRVSGQELEVALEVTDIPPPHGASAELVRSAAGDALAIWVRSTGWFVHPLDLENGLVDAPYLVTPAQLSAMSEPCADGAEGFLLTAPVTPDPFAQAAPGTNLRSFEGRFRVSSLGVCLDALAAQGDAGTTTAKTAGTLRAAGRPTVTTTLTERKPLGRRVQLVCSK